VWLDMTRRIDLVSWLAIVIFIVVVQRIVSDASWGKDVILGLVIASVTVLLVIGGRGNNSLLSAKARRKKQNS